MAFWLVKSEPFKYSWDKFVADGRTHWDGVRNHQAANNLKAMRVGDQAFFYHSNEGLEIVGIAEVVREAYPDPSDESGKFVMVDLKPVTPVKVPVTLQQMKQDPVLSQMQLIKQSRLSVCPVTPEQWAHACRLAGVELAGA
ncbi:EVE domain-containing protein [Aerophototrophica crusticola]|uniref:EVE domain-containing protein n=1 Tax=Aerophototrophica crusticola TaxID=1709002 RepID=A0A858RD55_9PROT|nr:EVE domain-containing protein [Rhodospirillaceae bacterium B3]